MMHVIRTNNNVDTLVQVFFVEDRVMRGWCVVLKKECRGRRIISTEVDYGLGQEESRTEREALREMGPQVAEPAGIILGMESEEDQRRGRRRNRN